MSGEEEFDPQRPPYYRVVPRQMWTAECVHCGRDLFADDGEYVAWSHAESVGEVLTEGYWRCKCGAPLTESEAELLAEADAPYHWEHRDPPAVEVKA